MTSRALTLYLIQCYYYPGPFRELKHARFLNAGGNRKRTFHGLDRIVSQIFILLVSNGEKILCNVNVVV